MAEMHADIKYIVKSIDEIKSEMYQKGGIKDTCQKSAWDIADLKGHRNKLYAFLSAVGLLALGQLIIRIFHHAP